MSCPCFWCCADAGRRAGLKIWKRGAVLSENTLVEDDFLLEKDREKGREAAVEKGGGFRGDFSCIADPMTFVEGSVAVVEVTFCCDNLFS
jgi:hypothetical protein